MSVVPFWMKLQRALDKQLPGQVTYLVDWKKARTGRWLGPKSQPVALLLHHTAGAATESTDPKAAGLFSITMRCLPRISLLTAMALFMCIARIRFGTLVLGRFVLSSRG